MTQEDNATVERRERRMLDAMLEHGNRNARMVVTVTLERADGRSMHQAFRFRAWDGREGKMLTADLMDGDWSAGVRPTKVVHVDVASGRIMTARDDGRAYDDKLVLYAARAAALWVLGEDLPNPANGSVECVTSDFCSVCGRELIDDTSVALGIGPECEKRVYGRRTPRSRTIVSQAAPGGETQRGDPEAQSTRDARTPVAEDTVLNFAYGMNMDARGMPAGATLVGPALLDGYGLRWHGVADVEPAEGESVMGVLWRLTPDALLRLDGREGYPHMYDRHTVTVTVDGEPVEALVYRMTPEQLAWTGNATGPEDSSPQYIEMMRHGREQVGWPTDDLPAPPAPRPIIERSLDEHLRGVAGDFAVVADGYVLGKRRDSREAISAAADAWRSGRYRTVRAVDVDSGQMVVEYDA